MRQIIIEICSQAMARRLAEEAKERTSLVSITSTDEANVIFPSNRHIESILHLKLNDLTTDYDEDGLPYGRPLPKSADFAGLKDFVAGLRCERLIVHCWEGTSRSAALATAIYEARSCKDSLRTHQRFSPNPLVYRLACCELRIRLGELRYTTLPEGDHFRLGKDMLYIASDRPDEQSFLSLTALDNWTYTYAYTDPFLAIAFFMPGGPLLQDPEILLEEANGRAILWEGRPEAFSMWYRGRSCWLYGVAEDRFQKGVTGCDAERVLPSGQVPALFEEKIEDVYDTLLRGAKAGLCEMHTYSESEGYRSHLSVVREQERLRREKPEFIVEDGVLHQFIGPGWLPSVVVPDGVRVIGYRSFADSAVGSVTLPDGVTVIEEDAFYGSSLHHIEIPTTVRAIETWAFGLCENLEEVSIPENVTEIGPWAFGYLRSLLVWDPKPNPFVISLLGRRGSEAERYAERNYFLYNDNSVAFVEDTRLGFPAKPEVLEE